MKKRDVFYTWKYITARWRHISESHVSVSSHVVAVSVPRNVEGGRGGYPRSAFLGCRLSVRATVVRAGRALVRWHTRLPARQRSCACRIKDHSRGRMPDAVSISSCQLTILHETPWSSRCWWSLITWTFISVCLMRIVEIRAHLHRMRSAIVT